MTNLANIRAVLFDLDGTLVDTVDLIVAGFQHATNQHLGYTIAPATVKATIGRPLRDCLEELHPGYGERLFSSYLEFNAAHHDRLIKPVPNVDLVLSELQARGLPLGVVTSKRREVAQQGLRRFELERYFPLLITLEDVSKPKPAPDPLLLGAVRLGLKPAQVLYVGDAIHDIIAARAAGMPVVGVSWGAGTAAEFAARPPDCLIDEFATLLQIIAKE